MKTLSANIILPLRLAGEFTYSVPPEHAHIRPGMRVVVPFGKGRRLYTGLVRHISTKAPERGRTKAILSVPDERIDVLESQMVLWERIASHYMCTLGEVMAAALPAQLLLSSETRIMVAVGGAFRTTNPRELIMLQVLEQRHVLTLSEAGELLGLKDPMVVLKRMLDEGAIGLEEEMKQRYVPRSEKFVALAEEARTETALHTWFDKLSRAGKQLDLLMRFVELSRCLSDAPRPVKRSALLRSSGASASILSQLVKKGLLVIDERPADLPSPASLNDPGIQLSPAQEEAATALRTVWNEHEVALLRGVTSSGKTEIYMQLMLDAIAAGKRVLYLLPEIALTTQVIARLKSRLGDRISVFHSRLSQRERTELWLGMISDPERYPIIVGARSAVFLPFSELGLIIVDEEHDASYKQHDPAPRYHARDMAIVLGKLMHAKMLLGSATPSMESLFNAAQGKYGRVDLLERYGDVALPEIVRVDLREARKRHRLKGHFTQDLIDMIGQAIARGEQAIIFQNRRGYVPVWQCEQCGWIPECTHCDVSLTYHKAKHHLHCHYCGRTYEPPARCGDCGSARLRMLGFGTEKIEEEIKELLPEAKVARMDQDTTRGKHAFERILGSFGAGDLNVLVGTQMVTKGLDFDQVTVVGILQANDLMRFPDLRAHERAFQLMAQVAGRAGRRKQSGKVVLQAMDIEHPVIKLVMTHDVNGMYARELEHRRALGYPPFTRLVEFTLKHRYEERVAATAQALAAALRTAFGERVLGPEAPAVSRIRDKHIRKVIVKLRKSSYAREKEILRDLTDEVFARKEHSPVQLIIDVDPQ